MLNNYQHYTQTDHDTKAQKITLWNVEYYTIYVRNIDNMDLLTCKVTHFGFKAEKYNGSSLLG